MTHAAVATKLGISRSYFSRLAREGCPTTSTQAAKDWISARAAAVGTAPSPATLNDARLRKVLLECGILQIRLERESANTAFLPVESVTTAATMFLRWGLIHLKLQADALAEELAAATTPQAARGLLASMISESWGLSAVATMAQGSLDKRLVNAIKTAIHTEFPKVSDELVDGWIEAARG